MSIENLTHGEWIHFLDNPTYRMTLIKEWAERNICPDFPAQDDDIEDE